MEKIQETEEDIMACEQILLSLLRMGYHQSDIMDAIHIIHENNINISPLKFPYNCKTLDEWENVEKKLNKKSQEIEREIYQSGPLDERYRLL